MGVKNASRNSTFYSTIQYINVICFLQVQLSAATSRVAIYIGGHFHWLSGASSMSGSHGLHCNMARASASSRWP